MEQTIKSTFARNHPVRTGLFAVLGVIALGTAAGFALGYDLPEKAFAQVTVLPPITVVAPPPVTPVITPPVILPPTTVLPPITVIGPRPGTDDPYTPPCCTNTEPPAPEPPPPPPPPSPPVDDPYTPPCCTVPPTPPVVPPVLPPVVPPVVPPVEPPVEPPEEPPTLACVFLRVDKTEIRKGESVTLSWKTHNADSITINNGVGSVTPVAAGSKTVTPSGTTTYVATVSGDAGPSVNCQVQVVVTDSPPPSFECVYLKADKSRIEEGESVELSWETRNADSITINNGVGSVTPVRAGSVTVRPTGDTEYVATVTGPGPDDHCRVSVIVDDEDEPPGGGGGGGRRSARVGIDSFVPALEEPLSYVYLSEVPYTGLELGPVGTVIYWIMLIGWSAALAYLVLFNAVPFALARVRRFGTSVNEALNSDAPSRSTHGHEARHDHAALSAHPGPAVSAAPRGYDAHDGFRSFAAGDGLTIDDIVKGLAREMEQKHAAAPMPVPAPEETPAPAPQVMQEAPAPQPPAAITGDVRDFIKALLDGDRDTVFGMIRTKARSGEDTELFVSEAACALDDAYRACIDGTTCHPDIAELTSGCHPSFLEKLVASLTTAVDGSYSTGMTGVKMALTRALGVVAG